MDRQYFLDHFVNKSGKISPSLARQPEHILIALRRITSFLPDEAVPKERIFCLINNVTELQTCKREGCNNRVALLHGKYNEYCGYKCSASDKKTQEKKRNTCLEKYGVEHVSQLEDVKDKKKQSYLERYGVEYISQSPEIREKINKTWEDRYGSHILQSDEFKKKRNDTLIDKFGVSSPLANTEICDKMIQTQLDKYGRVGGLVVKSSKAELEILDFLNSCGGEFVKNSTILDGKELDGYSEKHKLAIEYNGLFYHSEQHGTPKLYHYNKWLECKSQGIQLISIFEDEWLYKPEKVKSFLKSKIGVFDKRIPARATDIEIDRNVVEFLKNNHLQGAPHSIVRSFSLVLNNEIIGVVSFGRHHRISNRLVLNRLAFKAGVQVIGGVAKLMKNALKNINESIITWSDNRWSTGEIYRKNGFTFDKALAPDYSYIGEKRTRISKQSMMKSKIGCPDYITEEEFCKSLGLNRIYDCGKIRWRYEP